MGVLFDMCFPVSLRVSPFPGSPSPFASRETKVLGQGNRVRCDHATENVRTIFPVLCIFNSIMVVVLIVGVACGET